MGHSSTSGALAKSRAGQAATLDAALVNSAGGYILASLAPSTRLLYAKAMCRLQDFTCLLVHEYSSFPASVPLICIFIAHLFEASLARATVLSILSGIAFFHKLFKFPDPTTDFLVKRMLLGAQKAQLVGDTRLPIALSMLHRLCDSSSRITNSVFSASLVRAMFLTMFHVFLRIGEVTSSQNNLMLDQISMLPNCVVIIFYRAKHLVGPPISISVPASGGTYCPVSNLSRYLAMRGSTPGPLFCLPDMKPISSAQFNSWLTSAIEHNSLSSLPIKAHSFRIGAATHAATIGYTEIQIQKMGRWKSSAFKSYIRISSFHTI